MSISDEYLTLFTSISKQISLPRIANVYLPKPIELPEPTKSSEKKDDFGVVVLENGSAGAFYISLDDTLEQLKIQFPEGAAINTDCLSLIKKITSNSLYKRAVALGVINAVSQFVMNQSGFSASLEKNSQKANKNKSTGISQAKKGERIGMIGFFKPLIERLLEKEIEVMVLEKNPGRVELQQGVILTEDVTDLSTCHHILCTASTLINNTLDEVLKNSKQAKTFSLIGPSGSSLPDILFKHGVNAVGGFHFDDIPVLKQAFIDQESWGHAGNKYQLTPDTYPGVEALLKKMVNPMNLNDHGKSKKKQG